MRTTLSGFCKVVSLYDGKTWEGWAEQGNDEVDELLKLKFATVELCDNKLISCAYVDARKYDVCRHTTIFMTTKIEWQYCSVVKWCLVLHLQ